MEEKGDDHRNDHKATTIRAPREMEAMKDSSDAIGDWLILSALLNTASGASWVAVHHGGIDIGKSMHASAGYEAEQKAAHHLGIVIPMLSQ